jgi:hypothetical protein
MLILYFYQILILLNLLLSALNCQLLDRVLSRNPIPPLSIMLITVVPLRGAIRYLHWDHREPIVIILVSLTGSRKLLICYFITTHLVKILSYQIIYKVILIQFLYLQVCLSVPVHCLLIILNFKLCSCLASINFNIITIKISHPNCNLLIQCKWCTTLCRGKWECWVHSHSVSTIL